MWLVGRYTERRAHERMRALARLATHFLDVVRGLPTLRAFNRGPAQVEQIERVADEYRRATMGTLRIAFLSGTVLELAATLGIALVAVTVGVRLVEGGVGFEAGLTVLVLAPELYLPLRNLAAQYHASADGLAVASRLLDLDRGRPGRPREATPARRGRARRRSASRTSRSSIRPGAGSCSTRSTSSWRRARPSPLSGRRGAARPPSHLSFSGWRTRRAVACSQGTSTSPHATRPCGGSRSRGSRSGPTLFRGTVAENIRLGRPSADDDRMRRAAALAGAAAFVADLPDGYDTVVGDGGRPLSAGQAQRIALARSFLRDAPLVILDEPTADLDPVSAELVGEAVERLRDGRSILLLVHRPELARRADRIVTIDAGRIVEPARDAA